MGFNRVSWDKNGMTLGFGGKSNGIMSDLGELKKILRGFMGFY